MAFHRPHLRRGDLAAIGFALQHNLPAPGGLRLYPPLILPLPPGFEHAQRSIEGRRTSPSRAAVLFVANIGQFTTTDIARLFLNFATEPNFLRFGE